MLIDEIKTDGLSNELTTKWDGCLKLFHNHIIFSCYIGKKLIVLEMPQTFIFIFLIQY